EPNAACGAADLLAGKVSAEGSGVAGNLALVTDEAVAPEGAFWDAPAAIKLEGARAAITFDFGAPQEIGALYIQADANDSYRVSGSLDGAPGSFKFIAEFKNVVDTGPGLRSRFLQI